MQRNYLIILGQVTYISELQTYQKEKGTLYKKTLTIETEDGQVFYPEIRNENIKILELEAIRIGDRAQIAFSFEGSEKNGKFYNNIHIANIKKY